MKMGFYTINLGTERGQKLHSCHLVILPLIPILILLMQYATAYSSNITKISKVIQLKNPKLILVQLEQVRTQVTNALDFALLTRRLQEERLSVALNFFIRPGKLFTCSI